jgi:hypothetical protein
LWLVRTRLPVPDWNWRIAADPLGYGLADAHAQHARRLPRRNVLWTELAETAALLALLAAELVVLLGVNLALVYIASRWIGERDDFPIGEGLLFAALGTLILWLYDAYRPLAEISFAKPRSA